MIRRLATRRGLNEKGGHGTNLRQLSGAPARTDVLNKELQSRSLVRQRLA